MTTHLEHLQQRSGRLVAHNLEHDAGIIKAELVRAGGAAEVPLLKEMAEAGFCTMEHDARS